MRLTLSGCIPSRESAALIAVSAGIGFVGFSTIPRASALILIVLVLWTLASSRGVAFACVLAYKLAASRGLLPGAAVFLSESHTPAQAAALYFLLSFGASLPFYALWAKEKKRKALCLIGAFLVAYLLPPFSLIGILNPLMASETIFRGWGFVGILAVLSIYVLCALSGKAASASVCVVALFAVLPGSVWYEPPRAEGIAVIDTSFGKLGSGSFNFARDYERAGMVFDSLATDEVRESQAKIVVLPETIAGRLNDTGLKLWQDGIGRLLWDKAVLFGAELPTGDGRKYDNALLMLHEGQMTAVRQRVPVPHSMYRGPFAKTGARLHILDDGILDLPDGRRAAVVVYYEVFLSWSVLRSMMNRPDLLLIPANLWWCRETSIPAAMERVVSLWALTFGVPVVSARNM